MRISILLLSLLVSLHAFSQTQAEMNKEAYEEYRRVDEQLNHIYKEILVQYKSDTAFIKKLKESQRIWITFRDAELAMKYPNAEGGYYGSIHPMCRAMYLNELTKVRIRTLMTWLSGVADGDACSGSVRLKE